MKAIIYTVEAVLGAVVILIGIMSIFPIQQSREVSLSESGYLCLEYLDQSGFLRYYAVNGMSADLYNGMKNCLPSSVDFDIKACASADCTAATPNDRTVYVSSYLIAGENAYDRMIINLWIWLK